MLVLTRLIGQTLLIDEDIRVTVTVIEHAPPQARLRIEAPLRAFQTVPPEQQVGEKGVLSITLQKDDRFSIQADISLVLVDFRGDRVRIGINAPPHCVIHRQEVWDAIQQENLAAAALDSPPVAMATLRVSRHPGESLMVGDHIQVTLLETAGPEVRLAITTPDAAFIDIAPDERREAGQTFQMTMKAHTRRPIARGVVLVIQEVGPGQAELQIEAPAHLPVICRESRDRLRGT